MTNHTYAVIMAGGEGTRFAPLSTPEKPKQFLNFIGDATFIRQTFERVLPLVPAENILVSTNGRYVDIAREQIPEISAENVIAEPLKKNTGPALAYCAGLIHRRDASAVMLCLPSDHHITDENGFRTALANAVSLARDGHLVTLGMKPTFASPDLGYICPSSEFRVPNPESRTWFPVSHFSEKPDVDTAQKYVESGYLWNGGIFIWQTKVFLDEVRKHAPELNPLFTAHGSRFTVHDYFTSAPSISIDFALMEKSRRVAVIPCEVGWSDVGTWDGLRALHRQGVKISQSALKEMKRKCDTTFSSRKALTGITEMIGD